MGADPHRGVNVADPQTALKTVKIPFNSAGLETGFQTVPHSFFGFAHNSVLLEVKNMLPRLIEFMRTQGCNTFLDEALAH